MKKLYILIELIIVIFLIACKSGNNTNSIDASKKDNYTTEELSQLLINFTGPITNLTSMQELIDEGANVNEAVVVSEGNLFNGKENILEKAFENNIKSVELLVNNGADVNYELSDGKTPFFLAVNTYNTELCDLFIQNGADIKKKSKNGYSALDCMLYAETQDMVSGYEKQKNMIEYLEKKGLKLSLKSIQAMLECGEEKKDGYIISIENIGLMKHVVCELLIRGNETGLDNIIECAFQSKNKDIIRLCKRKNYLNELSKSEKNILLLICASYCNVDVLKELEAKGINLKDENSNDINALLCAAAYNDKDVTSYLLRKGLRMNSTEEHYGKALDYAILGRKIENIDYLIKNNAIIDDDIMSSLALISDTDILDRFIRYLKQNTKYNVEGFICEGIECKNKVVLQYISEYALNKSKEKNYVGQSIGAIEDISFIEDVFRLNLNINEVDILYNAIINYNDKLVKYMLEERKIDVNRYYDEYEIPLMGAIETGNIDMIEYLVKQGANVDIKDGDGDDILDIAKKYNYSKEVKEYIEKISYKK